MYYIGEGKFTKMDQLRLAGFKQRDNYGSERPIYYAALQCPVCANLAAPDDGKIYCLMLHRLMIYEPDRGLATNFCERLCCKSCFMNTLEGGDQEYRRVEIRGIQGNLLVRLLQI